METDRVDMSYGNVTADHFGVMGAVASMALLGVNCGKRGSDGDGVGASGR